MGVWLNQGSEELSKQFGEKAMRAYVAHALDWLEEVEVALVENQEWVMLLEDDLGTPLPNLRDPSAWYGIDPEIPLPGISAEPKEVAAQAAQYWLVRCRGTFHPTGLRSVFLGVGYLYSARALCTNLQISITTSYSVAHPGLARASGPYCSGAVRSSLLPSKRPDTLLSSKARVGFERA
eukprot:2483250-Rhodomonas_salina.4